MHMPDEGDMKRFGHEFDLDRVAGAAEFTSAATPRPSWPPKRAEAKTFSKSDPGESEQGRESELSGPMSGNRGGFRSYRWCMCQMKAT
jgi:hypothetical protein